MKLLFDQNISYRLVKKIQDILPESKQVVQLNLENATDAEIWTFAKANQYTIVTFDADFFDISILNGHPPKIIWIRSGNISTHNLETLLRNNINQIEEFDLAKELSCLQLF